MKLFKQAGCFAIHFCVILVVFFHQTALAKTYQSHQVTEAGITIQLDIGQMTIKPIHEMAVEVMVDGQYSRNFPSFALTPELNRNVPFKFIESEQTLTLSTKRLSVSFDKSSTQISYHKDGEPLTREEAGYFEQATLQGFRFVLSPEERLLGTGQRVLGMDRRGHRLPLYNRAHYGYGTHSEQMNYSLPAIMSSKKYMILFDNSAKGAIDLGKSESDVLQFEAIGGRQSYLLIAGDSYPELINHYVDVTGKQPMPPRWALGNHASRFGYKSQQQVIDTINKYQEASIPVDAIILDLYWFGKEVQGHMGNLAWDNAAFPEPEKMIRTLKDKGVKTTLITEPFVLTSSKRWDEAVENDVLAKNIAGTDVRIFDFFFGETGLIDVFHKPAQDWFGDIYKELSELGVAGVWGDLGEPEVHPADMQHQLSDWQITASSDEIHNAFGHEWAKLAYQSSLQANPDQRPFILMRAGFAGSQRYGLIPWTGDVSRSWDGLKPQPELTMQMGLFGLAYTHSDLGGFAGGEQFDKEMYIRWLQYGVFQPIYRPHAQDAIAPEPVFHDQETQSIIREYIKLRYRLMPYNYTLAYLNSQQGLPMMRPMFFEDESDLSLIDYKDQYLWGDAFLVKPVTEEGVKKVNVYLPQGQWTDFWTGEKYQVTEENGKVVEYPVNLTKLPVLVRGGSIIPTVRDHQNASEYSSQSLRFDLYFDPSKLVTETLVYEDDGISPNSVEKGEYELIKVKATGADNKGQAVMTLAFNREVKGAYSGIPKQRELTNVIHHWPNRPKDIKINGQSIAIAVTKSDFDLEATAAFYNFNTKQLIIKTNWQNTASEIIIN